MRRLNSEKKKTQNILNYLNNKKWFLYLYNNICINFILNKLLCYLMKNGEKSKSIRIFENSCFLIKKLTRISPIYVIKKSISNCLFMFDHRLSISKSKNKKKKKSNINHTFGFITPLLRLKRSIRFLYIFSSNIYDKQGRKLCYSERLAIGILLIFFRKSFFFEEFTSLYKLMLLKKLKLKEILKLQRSSKKFIIKAKRNPKNKGSYLFNPYSFSNWYKEL